MPKIVRRNFNMLAGEKLDAAPNCKAGKHYTPLQIAFENQMAAG